MNATDIANFQSAVGEFSDAVWRLKTTATYQAAIAGMQAENMIRVAQGHPPIYGEGDFSRAYDDYFTEPKVELSDADHASLATMGPMLAGMAVHHVDGDPGNNDPVNLVLVERRDRE